MKIKLTILLLVLSIAGLRAQTECTYYYGKFTENNLVRLFGDRVNMRAAPNTTSALVDNEGIGSVVELLGPADETYTMNGYTTNWYKVGLFGAKEGSVAYVWGGLLSMVSAELPNDAGGKDVMVYGLTGWANEGGFKSAVRIVRDNKLLTSLEFEPIASGFFDAGVFGHSVCVKIDGNHGFKGIKNIIRLEFIYEACGYENGEIFLLWDGNKLTYLAKASQVTEAGVFAYTYTLTFPDDEKGKANTLQIKQEYIESEYNDDVEKVIAHEVTLKQFSWDGSAVTALPEEVEKIK
jgi:hypothetical protein